MLKTTNRPKIFFIGYHKTATTALHKLVLKSGYTSYHHSKISPRKMLALTMQENLSSNQPILKGIDDADAYSDLAYHRNGIWLDENENFDLLYEEYPDAYFILQNRDTESWIKSRDRHKDYTKRCMSYLKVDQKEIVFDHWRKQKTKHEERVRKFFSERPQARFLEWDITEDVQQVIDFLSLDYELDIEQFRRTNVSQ